MGSSGVWRDVLPNVPRPTLSRDEPPFALVEHRPVPRNMKISQDIIRKFGYTPGCVKCRKLSRNEYSHPSLAHSQDCRTRIEAASRTDPVYRDRAERGEQRKMEFYAKGVERIDHSRRSSLEPSVIPGTTSGETEILRSDPEVEDHSSVRDVKRARGEPEQDLSGEIPIPSADETLVDHSRDPCVAIRCDSFKFDFNSDLSWSKRAHSESSTLPNSPCVSSGSGVKRAHGDSIVNDDDEQPGTRARLSA